ncbi:phage adaptor protein [Streptomyces rochei]|uniref:phage adaptor protein n=1 Tax=Streptomyces rochei TaxID=1928 RepID=UPI0036F7A927
MTTLDQLVRQVRQQLLGYSMSQESVSELSAAMGPTDTTFSCDPSTVGNISRGLVEIDDELILVKSFDAQSGLVAVMGQINGRGYEGTTAASHEAAALVTSSPAFPKARIKAAINETIRSLYPTLVVFGSTEITKLAPVVEYELPSEVEGVWYVTGQLVGPSKVAQPLPNWRYNPKARSSVFPSGKSIQLFDYVTAGQAMKVVYSKGPQALTSGSDDFTATGYPERYTDLVVYGACKRLVPALESARLQLQAVETTERAPLVPPASATKVAQLYASLFAERLDEERTRQFDEIPNYATFQGS